MARRACFVVLGSRARASKLFFKPLQLFVGKILEVDEFIARVFDRPDELVQFQMNCFGVPVLRILNQEYHQERDNGRAGINNELPGVRKMKRWSGRGPNYDDENGYRERPRAAQNDRGVARENAKCILDDAKEIPVALVFFQFCSLGLVHN